MYLLRSVVYLILSILTLSCNQSSDRGKKINLVPERKNPSPDYWCTWGAQNYATDTFSVKHTLALGGHSVTAGYLTEENLFGTRGWSEQIPLSLRENLILLFDLGWDVPAGQKFEGANWELGSLVVAEDKFPSCSGSPEERLKRLRQMVMENGWKGIGLWLPSHPYGDHKNGVIMSDIKVKEYYAEGLRVSKNAGINYWKIDYGFRAGEIPFREMITRMAEETDPGLVVEHARGGGPLNDVDCPWDTKNIKGIGSFRSWDDGNILRKAVEIAMVSDVFRTYDITQQLSVPTTLDRVAQIMHELSGSGADVIVNCEDEPYIGAVLGCALGILRHPGMIEPEGYNYDPLHFKNRTDEVVRAVKWHRIAPAFGAGVTENNIDTVVLSDHWRFQEGDSWATWVTGRDVIQVAPARVARGMPLPEVIYDSISPYVICSTHPNGSVAVGTLPRTNGERKIVYPMADVVIRLNDASRPVGIFGRFKSLTIILPTGMHHKKINVFGQDLAGNSAVEITSQITIERDRLVVPGDLITKTGLSAASKGDLSDPGMVLRIQI